MYFGICWSNSEQIAKIEILQVATAADRVFVTYMGQRKDGKRFRNAEVHTLRGGQVVDVEVYFGWSVPHPAPLGTHDDEAARRA